MRSGAANTIFAPSVCYIDANHYGAVPLWGALKTNALPDEMNLSQIWLAKDAGCLAGIAVALLPQASATSPGWNPKDSPGAAAASALR